MTTCPKCSYTRQPDDTAPDYECPKCGIVYAKYHAAMTAAAEKRAAAPAAPQGVTVSARETICTSCGSLGSSTQHTKGSIGIEIVLWLFLLIPGLIYSIWRHTSRGTVCGQCGASRLISVATPVGRKMLQEWHSDAVIDVAAKPVGPSKSFGDRVISAFYAGIALLLVGGVLLAVVSVAFR